MKNLFLLIFSVITSACISQKNVELKDRVELNFESITKSFDAKNLDYIGSEKYCNSGSDFQMNGVDDCENCYSYKDIYIFWSENGNSYVQKFDTCSEYNIVEISGFDASQYLKTNFEDLQNQMIGPYKLEDNSYLEVSHTCYGSYIFNYKSLRFGVDFDYFKLRGENENINYKKNNALKIIVLDKKLESIIDGLENQKSFKRDKSTCKNRI